MPQLCHRRGWHVRNNNNRQIGHGNGPMEGVGTWAGTGRWRGLGHGLEWADGGGWDMGWNGPAPLCMSGGEATLRAGMNISMEAA
eukprot:350071-Chlamydomonas_euryale.AAC.1